MSEWISVNTELPANRTVVLAIWSARDIASVGYLHGEWCRSDFSLYDLRATPLGWMPLDVLPEPPEANSE